MALHSWMLATMFVATSVLRAQPVTQQPVAAPPVTIRFKPFVINDDPTYTGMEVTHGLMPADWTLKGGVVWELRDGFPAQFRLHMSDPKDVAAFDVYPNHYFFWSQRAAMSPAQPPDARYMGLLIQKPPADQFEALAQVIIPRDRPDLARARVVEQKRLPDVAKAVYESMAKLPGGQYGAAVGRALFEYEFNGQTVQEEMYVCYKRGTDPKLGIMNWSVENVTSTRAPKGQLDQLNALRAVTIRSCRPNPAWYDKVTQFILMRQRATMEQLADQEQRRQIFMKMRSDISDENKKEFDQHMADIDRQSDLSADYMREVSPWKTSDGSAVKLPNAYGHAWEGANGEIIMNNDALYNPNSDPNTHTTWTPLQQASR
jgi:hypothetical protein